MAALLAIPAALASMAGVASAGATAAGGALGTIGTVASIGSTIIGTVGALAQGQQAKEASKYEAAQLKQRGNEEFALASRRGQAAQRQKELTQSALVARAADSTGDTMDPTVLNLGGGIENRGEAQALMEFYKGGTAKDRYEDAGKAAIWKGEQAQTASYFKAGSTILDGFSSIANKYGRRGLPSASYG